jgi:glycosyltransferase involved in cell wall biosynthesis
MTLGALITYYGERDLLRECLESLATQSQPPDEILVYDDASPAPAEDYVPPGTQVRVLHGETNRGPAHGRNQLLLASRSEFVHFHDADDLFHPDWCTRVRAALTSPDVDVVFTEIDVAGDKGVQSRHVLALEHLTATKDLLRFCINGVMLVPSGTYRRQRLIALGGYRTSLWQAEDFDFHIRLAASRPRYAVINDSLVTIRVRPEGRSRNQQQTWRSYVQAVGVLASELPDEYRPDLADAAARAGSMLFKLGCRPDAFRAFELATRLGPPRFTTQRAMYRALARLFGYEVAERVSQAYRALLPGRLRVYLAR